MNSEKAIINGLLRTTEILSDRFAAQLNNQYQPTAEDLEFNQYVNTYLAKDVN